MTGTVTAGVVADPGAAGGHEPGPAPIGRVLVLDADPTSGGSVARIARAAATDVEVCHAVADVPPDVACDLLAANYDALSERDREDVFARFACLRDRGRLLVYFRNAQRRALEALFGRRELMNLLALDGDADGGELLVTIRKMLGRDIFGIERYFPWGARAESLVVRRSSERSRVLAAVEAFVAGSGVQPRLGELLCTVADELTSNALYNAPVGSEGRPRHAHLARTVEVELLAGEQVELTLCSDGRRVGIAVVDPFGSLTAPTVRHYLAKCFQRGPGQIDDKAGGAGLGLYQTLEALSHFVINVRPGARTEMIGLLDVRGSYRTFASRGKSFNIFVAD